MYKLFLTLLLTIFVFSGCTFGQEGLPQFAPIIANDLGPEASTTHVEASVSDASLPQDAFSRPDATSTKDGPIQPLPDLGHAEDGAGPTDAAEADQGITSPLDQGITPPLDQSVASPPDQNITPPLDQGITLTLDQGITPPPDQEISSTPDQE